MVVPLLLVFMPVSTGLALFLLQLALVVVATLSYICGVRINVRLKRLRSFNASRSYCK